MSTTGFNFRGSSGYVTDGAGEIYVLSADLYPTTRGGWTFGWVTTGPISLDRDSADDPRLAGCALATADFVNYSARTFRIDLPATGDYDVRAAFGDPGSAQANAGNWDLKDDTTTFASSTGNTSAANQFRDATGVLRTSQADWITNNVAATRTFGSTILNVASTGAAILPALAHVSVTPSGGGGGGSAVGADALHHYREHVMGGRF